MADEQDKPIPAQDGEDKIDFDKQPAEVKALFERLLEDKRQANKEAQAAKKHLRDLESAKEQSERAALEEQSKFKDLYEKEKVARAQVEQETQAKLLGLLKEKVGIQAGLPQALISRLQGTSEDELKADAELIKAALPQSSNKPSGTQSNTTQVPRGTQSGMSDEQIRAWLRGGENEAPAQPRKEGNTLIFGG